MKIPSAWWAALALGAAAGSAPAAQVEASEPPALAWTATEQTYHAAANETKHTFEFTATNRSSHPVVILDAKPSCGCTVATLAHKPWTLAPGETASIGATVNYQSKWGRVTKSMKVLTSAGNQTLLMEVDIPGGPRPAPSVPTALGIAAAANERARNQEIAAARPRSVFRGDCARCHAAPAFGKSGRDLYVAACAICHEADHRASMVPDLAAVRPRLTADDWRRMVAEGKARTLMPAFAHAEGGPLSDDQIGSLVAYLVQKYPPKS